MDLGIENHISKKARGCESDKKYFVTQFGDVLFYRFLESIGLMPNKSLRLCSVSVPDEYFLIFFAGTLTVMGRFTVIGTRDGNQAICFTRSLSRQVKTTSSGYKKKSIAIWVFVATSRLSSHMATTKMSIAYQLKYAKAESLLLLPHIYPTTDVLCLKRKHLKIIKALSILVKL